MIQSKQKVKDLCDKLFQVKPHQIVTDLVQDDIEEIVESDTTTPDDINALCYQCDLLLNIYNPAFEDDIEYLDELKAALEDWAGDAEFANRSLGIDPNN